MADRNVIIRDKAGKKPRQVKRAKTASTAFDKNSLVEFASGVVNPSDDNDVVVYGIIKEEVAATDSDYATTAAKTVEIIEAGDEVEITTTSTLTPGVSYGISNAYTVDASDTTNKVFNCKRVISSTRAIGTFLTYQGGNAV